MQSVRKMLFACWFSPLAGLQVTVTGHLLGMPEIYPVLDTLQPVSAHVCDDSVFQLGLWVSARNLHMHSGHMILTCLHVRSHYRWRRCV